MKRLMLMGVLFCLALVSAAHDRLSSGDEKAGDKKAADKKAADKKAANEKEAAGAGKVSVKIVDWEETLEIVASHKGKIVVLDAWATSCPPCMKEFPNLVKLHKRYADKGVVCISLSCDYQGIKNKPPAFYHERVVKFLEKQGAVFQNLMSNVDAEQMYENMEVASIPTVFVFGRDGKIKKRFDNAQAKTEEDSFTYADVNRLVEELLAAE